jgi:hypothetical protein
LFNIDTNIYIKVSPGTNILHAGTKTILAFYLLNGGPEESRDSAVGIVIGYGMDDRGVTVRVPVGSRMFSSPHRPDRL